MRKEADAMRAMVVTLRPTFRPALRTAVLTSPLVETPPARNRKLAAMNMRIAARIAAPEPINAPAWASPPSCVARMARANDATTRAGARKRVHGRRAEDLRFEI